MRARAGLVGGLVAALLAGPLTAVAEAAGEQKCYWDPGAGRLRCDNSAPGGPIDGGGGEGGGGSGKGKGLGRWLVWINDIVPDPVTPCPPDPATGAVPPRRYLQFLPTGNLAGIRTVDSWCSPAEVRIPPPPPTPAELRGLAQAPAPTVNLAPSGRGVTGLPVRLWAEAPTTLVVGPLALRGWSVTGRASTTKWEWSMGDMRGTRNPGRSVSATRPGSETDPAATYTYETKGGYTVEMAVTYDGGFTVTGPYGVTLNASIGAITVTGSRPYTVIEVRAGRD